MTLILGIETSCDETAAAVIQDGRVIHSNVVASQIDLHRQYGGIFPEMASRQHVIAITPVIEQAMSEAGVQWAHLDAVAVTHGPGLAGSLLVGVNAAKGLAYGIGRPLIGVNHLESHIAANWLDVAVSNAPDGRAQLEFPLLCLIVSGGHSELILMLDCGKYRRLGGTIDDAAGEAFDKVARMLGLDYPGGPAIQRAAKLGNATAFSFTRARTSGRYDFSFSGLKTAVLRQVQKYKPALIRPADALPGNSARPGHGLRAETVANLAASFQASVVDALVEKTRLAAMEHQVNGVLLAGGVAANRPLRAKMAATLHVPVRMPPIALATDNAAGVGVAGFWALQQGRVAGWGLDIVSRLKLGDQSDPVQSRDEPGSPTVEE